MAKTDSKQTIRDWEGKTGYGPTCMAPGFQKLWAIAVMRWSRGKEIERSLPS